MLHVLRATGKKYKSQRYWVRWRKALPKYLEQKTTLPSHTVTTYLSVLGGTASLL